MTDRFVVMPKYEAYKDSGAEWLGDIPINWDLLANKYIFKLKKNQVGKKSKDYVLLSLTLNGVIKRDMENPQGKFPAEFDTYQEVKSGDFIFCLFDVEETPRAVGLSPFNGMITGAYTVFESRDIFDKKFFYYFYLNLDANKLMKPLYKGLRNTIPKERFFEFKSFVPPAKEQTAIANFLDHKTIQIDQAIAIKEKQIELLKESKQILIQNTVTQGLDPKVPMKNTAVDWIGKIPKHWNIKKLVHVAKIDSGATPDRSRPDYWGGKIPWLKTGEINYKLIESSEEYITEAGMRNASVRLAPVGTLLMAMYGQGITRGRVALLGIQAAYNQACCSIQLNKDFLKEYGLAFFTAAYQHVRDDGNESSQMNLSAGYISTLKITLPPLHEQKLIVKFLETETNRINIAIDLQNQQIEKLKEYKMTLINSAVTGKIKVS
ncbi:restriction endonuclease subunit S [uncultured Cocleimonas sp.]|uniref:restriction endonuclease subunit S n=1 Tax=uncultured Cocleimonas sp. TaxID=1051587 RepID=UPI002633C81F|nr:restriction endonuclease subunit S [uncultured Cocleimonas sp.]